MGLFLDKLQNGLEVVLYADHVQYPVGQNYLGKTCIAIATQDICKKTIIFVERPQHLAVKQVTKWRHTH